MMLDIGLSLLAILAVLPTETLCKASLQSSKAVARSTGLSSDDLTAPTPIGNQGNDKGPTQSYWNGPAISGSKLTKRAPFLDLDKQPDAPDDLVFFNWEEGHKLVDYKHQYFFHPSAGNGIPVYVVDSGAELNLPEFTSGDKPALKARWLFSDKSKNTDKTDGHGGKYHGTCMLSKIVGHTLGVAKKATPIIVKVEDFLSAESWYDALAAVSKDLDSDVTPPGNIKAIVSMSFYFPADGEGAPPPEYEQKLLKLLQELEHKGAFMVTGSGNEGWSRIKGYPAMWAAKEVPSLLVVGASELDGSIGKGYANIQSNSNYDKAKGIPSVYAPGYKGIKCASGGVGGPYSESGGGTSIAAASVSGLAAYFLGMEKVRKEVKTPLDMKKYIERHAWIRPGDSEFSGELGVGRACVHNGVKGLEIKALLNCNVQRRDGSGSSFCRSNPKGTTSATSSLKKTPGPTTLSTVVSKKAAAPTPKAPTPKAAKGKKAS